MFRHVVMMRWTRRRPGRRQRHRRGLGGLPAAIPELRDYRFGHDVGSTRATSTSPSSPTSRRRRLPRLPRPPAAPGLIAERITPHLAERAAVQFGGGPVRPDEPGGGVRGQAELPCSSTRGGAPVRASTTVAGSRPTSCEAPRRERPLGVGDVVEAEQRADRVAAQRRPARRGRVGSSGSARTDGVEVRQPGPDPGPVDEAVEHPLLDGPGLVAAGGHVPRHRAAGGPSGCRRRGPARRPTPRRCAAPARRPSTAPARRPTRGRSSWVSRMRSIASVDRRPSSPASSAASSPARLASVPLMRRSPVASLCWNTSPRAGDCQKSPE